MAPKAPRPSRPGGFSAGGSWGALGRNLMQAGLNLARRERKKEDEKDELLELAANRRVSEALDLYDPDPNADPEAWRAGAKQLVEEAMADLKDPKLRERVMSKALHRLSTGTAKRREQLDTAAKEKQAETFSARIGQLERRAEALQADIFSPSKERREAATAEWISVDEELGKLRVLRDPDIGTQKGGGTAANEAWRTEQGKQLVHTALVRARATGPGALARLMEEFRGPEFKGIMGNLETPEVWEVLDEFDRSESARLGRELKLRGLRDEQEEERRQKAVSVSATALRLSESPDAVRRRLMDEFGPDGERMANEAQQIAIQAREGAETLLGEVGGPDPMLEMALQRLDGADNEYERAQVMLQMQPVLTDEAFREAEARSDLLDERDSALDADMKEAKTQAVNEAMAQMSSVWKDRPPSSEVARAHGDGLEAAATAAVNAGMAAEWSTRQTAALVRIATWRFNDTWHHMHVETPAGAGGLADPFRRSALMQLRMQGDLQTLIGLASKQPPDVVHAWLAGDGERATHAVYDGGTFNAVATAGAWAESVADRDDAAAGWGRDAEVAARIHGLVDATAIPSVVDRAASASAHQKIEELVAEQEALAAEEDEADGGWMGGFRDWVRGEG